MATAESPGRREVESPVRGGKLGHHAPACDVLMRLLLLLWLHLRINVPAHAAPQQPTPPPGAAEGSNAGDTATLARSATLPDQADATSVPNVTAEQSVFDKYDVFLSHAGACFCFRLHVFRSVHQTDVIELVT